MRQCLGVPALLGCLAIACSNAEDGKQNLLPKAVAQEPGSSAHIAAVTAAAATPKPPERGAHGGAAPDPTEELLGMLGSLTTSSGAPARGTLHGAVELPLRGPGYFHNPRRPANARFATVETLQAVVRAAAVVEREMPGSTLTVNDFSLREGGPIPQHGSHQNGRDVDILFFALDSKGKPVPSVGVPFDPKGEGTDYKDLAIPGDDQPIKIDLPRTWRFMHALIEEAPDQVQRIFIVEHLRTMLLEEAKRAKAPKAVIQRFDEVTCQPSTPHDDHMHVRFFCTPEDMAAGCEDSAPLYPWRVAALNSLGLEPVIASTQRTPEERAARAARTTTAAQAKAKAGKLHWKVVKFLKEREAWAKQPHPGRPYCK